MPRHKRRNVNVKLLANEPTDGTGRVCIHLVVKDEVNGTFVEPHVLHPVFDAEGNQVKQKLEARPTRVRLACTDKPATTKLIGNVHHVTFRSDDPRGVTCPKCMASTVYAEMMARIEEM